MDWCTVLDGSEADLLDLFLNLNVAMTGSKRKRNVDAASATPSADIIDPALRRRLSGSVESTLVRLPSISGASSGSNGANGTAAATPAAGTTAAASLAPFNVDSVSCRATSRPCRPAMHAFCALFLLGGKGKEGQAKEDAVAGRSSVSVY